MSLLLVACGGASGGGVPAVEEPEFRWGSMSGYVSPAPSQSTVKMYDDQGALVRTATTDEYGYWEVGGQFPAGEYRMVVDHSGFVEVSGRKSKSGSYEATVQYTEGGMQPVHLSIFSGLAEIDASAIEEWLGFDPVRTAPATLSAENWRGDSFNNEIDHGLKVQAVSIAAQNLGLNDTQSFYELMKEDLQADNKLDGKGLGGLQLSFNGHEVSSDLYRKELGAAYVEASNDVTNITNVNGDVAIEKANIWANTSTATLNPASESYNFGHTEFLFTVDLPDASNLYSIARIELLSNQMEQASSISLYVDETLQGEFTIGDPAIYLLDTRTFDDGAHVARVEVLLTSGEVLTRSIEMTFYNEAPFINMISDTFASTTPYLAQFEIGGQLDGLTGVSINGSSAAFSDGIHSRSLGLSSGTNTIAVTLTFSGRLDVTEEFEVTSDTFPPNVDQVFHQYVTGYKVNYYNISNDELEARYLMMNSSSPFAATSGSLALGFVTPTLANLMERKHFFFQGRVDDAYSSYDSIDVAYTLYKNGESLNLDGTLDVSEEGLILLPITQEYFGSALSSAQIDDVFQIRISASDEAGNERVETFSFTLKVLTYDIGDSAVYPNGGLVSGNITYAPEGYFSDAVRVTLVTENGRFDALNPANPSFQIASSSLGEGDVNFVIEVETEYGHVYTENMNLTVDNTAPTIAITSSMEPTSPQYLLTGVASDLSEVTRVRVNDEYTNFDSASGVFSKSITLINGTNFIDVLAQDTVGNIATETIQIVYDTTKPEVELLSPVTSIQTVWQDSATGLVLADFDMGSTRALVAHPATMSYQGLALTINNLNNNNIPYLEFSAKKKLENGTYATADVTYAVQRDGVEIVADTALSPFSGNKFILPITTETLGNNWITGYEDHIYAVAVKATYDGRTTNASYRVRFRQANTQVMLPITSANYLKGADAMVSIPVSDLAGITSAVLSVNGQDFNSRSLTSMDFEIDTTQVADGVASLVLELEDRSGQVLREVMSATIDNTAPTGTFNIPDRVSENLVNIEGNISDATTGVSSFTVNGTEIPYNPNTGDFDVNFVIPDSHVEGEYTLNYSVVDKIGNTLTAADTVVVDPYFPEFRPLSPSNDQAIWVGSGASTYLGSFSFSTDTVINVYPGIETLNTVSVDYNSLIDASIPFLMFEAKVGRLGGGYNNPTVTYELTKNGSTVSAEQNLTAAGGFQYILPITEDYFGSDWFAGLDTDSYQIIIRVEEGGDVVTKTFDFKTHVANTTITNPLTSSSILSASNEVVVFYGADIAGLTSSVLTINGVSYNANKANKLSFAVDATALPSGLLNATLNLYDAAGLRFTQNMQVTVDRSAPTFTHDLPEMTRAYLLDVSGVVSDSSSSVASFTIDGEAVSFDPVTGEYTHTITVDPEAGNQMNVKNYNSIHTFVVKDQEGNTKTTDIEIIVDRMGSFLFNQYQSAKSVADTQCDGTPSGAGSWQGEQWEGRPVITDENKTLNGMDITDSNALRNGYILSYHFVTWSHVHDYYGILNRLDQVTYSYYVDDVAIFEDRPLPSLGTSGHKEVHNFRIAVTEEYLGEGFYQTSDTASHKIVAKTTDDLGFESEIDFNFGVCNYVDKGLDLNGDPI